MSSSRQIISLLYQTLEQPTLWESALETLADALKAEHVILGIKPTQRSELVISARVSDEVLGNYAKLVGNTPFHFLQQTAPVGVALNGDDLVEPSDMMDTEFYQQVVRPSGGHHALMGVPIRNADTKSYIVACRPPNKGRFSAQAQKKLHECLPHLTSVLRIRQRLDHADALSWQSEQVLHHLDFGIVLLDEHLHPRYLNPRASALIALHDGLSLNRHGLSASNATSNEQLQRLLHQVQQWQPDIEQDLRLSIPRTSGAAPFALRLMPLRHAEASALPTTEARLVIFIDAVDGAPLSAEHLAHWFQLTPREAELAALFSTGTSLNRCAEIMNIGIQTVRTHMDSLYAKTSTRKQAELVSVILRTVWRL